MIISGMYFMSPCTDAADACQASFDSEKMKLSAVLLDFSPLPVALSDIETGPCGHLVINPRGRQPNYFSSDLLRMEIEI